MTIIAFIVGLAAGIYAENRWHVATWVALGYRWIRGRE